MKEYVGSLLVEVPGDPDKNQRHMVLEALYRCKGISTVRFNFGTYEDGTPCWSLDVTLEWDVPDSEIGDIRNKVRRAYDHAMKTPFF